MSTYWHGLSLLKLIIPISRNETVCLVYGEGDNLLISFHPKYSVGEIVRIIKSLTARQLFAQHPWLKKELWGGEFWTDGYYVGTVGTGGNWAVVERYVKNQGHNTKDMQLSLW